MGNVKKMKTPKNRKTKVNLVFDEAARQEYLTGFRKRKNDRRKKANEEKELQLKNEKKEFKKQRKELLMKSFQYTGKSKQALPDVSNLVETEVHDLPQHTVTITDISEIDMAGHTGLRLGHNQFEDQEENHAVDKSPKDQESASALKKKLKALKRKQLSMSIDSDKRGKQKKLGLHKQKKKKFQFKKDKKGGKKQREKKDHRKKLKRRN